MIDVLLLDGTTRTPAFVADVIQRLQRPGVRVHLASLSPVSGGADVALDGLRHLRAEEDGFEPEFWRRADEGTSGEQMWRFASRDAWTVERAAQASVLVALDARSVYSVWMFAQSNPEAAARFGLHPAIKAVDALLERGEGSPAAPARPATPRRPVSRVWMQDRLAGWVESRPLAGPRRAHLLGSRLDDDRRVELAVPQIAALNRAGRLDEGSVLADAVGGKLATARARADLLGRVVAVDLGEGRTPAQLKGAYAAELTYSNRLLARGRTDRAIASFLQATRLAFHRAAHFNSTDSPLASDPSGFTRPLRRSQVLKAVTVPHGRERESVSPPTDRPVRILIMTDGNTNFVGDLHRHLETETGSDVRFVDPEDLAEGRGRFGRLRNMLASEVTGDGEARRVAERVLRPHLDWADVVFVDWVTRAAHFVSLVDPGTTRTILRLHSYEAWTLWPHLVDYSRIDRMIFVSEHLRELTMAAVPALSGEQAPEIHVVPNAMDLRRFALPKAEDARFTVAVLGFHVVAKDPRWAVEVIRKLRAEDERYRLLLIGADLPSEGTPALRQYAAALANDLAELEPLGAVVRVGRTEDVPAALVEAGVILSSSVREGSPLAVLEGAASGAVPVVRNWPFFARSEHGPRTLYPADWVVETVDEAVARILRSTRDAATWERLSREASAEAVRSWDLTSTDEHYRELFLR